MSLCVCLSLTLPLLYLTPSTSSMNFSLRPICPLTTSPTLFQLTHLLNGCSHTHPEPDAAAGGLTQYRRPPTGGNTTCMQTSRKKDFFKVVWFKASFSIACYHTTLLFLQHALCMHFLLECLKSAVYNRSHCIPQCNALFLSFQCNDWNVMISSLWLESNEL